MREEEPVEFSDLSTKLCFRRSHVRVLLQERLEGPFQQPAAVASFDQLMADSARSPVAYALSNHARDDVSHEALRRVTPSHVGR